MPVMPMVKMAVVVIKSALGGSACKMYPKRKATFYPATRGRLEFDPALCILCTLCAKKCMGGALEVKREGKTWRIDHLKCISCGLCVEVCPRKALTLRNEYIPPTAGGVTELHHVEPPQPVKTG